MRFWLSKERPPSGESQNITLTNHPLAPIAFFHQAQMITEVWPVLNLPLDVNQG